MGSQRPTVYFAVTGHGFGHGVRTACIVHRLQQICPEVLAIVASCSPHWLLRSYIEGPFIHRPVALDVGVIQADSLQMDQEATALAMEKIYGQKARLVAQEGNYLRQNRVDLVVADIPALAVAIAHYAGIPCWCVGNFGWNFIYRPWGERFAAIIAALEADYAQADRLFRLPLAEPMECFPAIEPVGLTGGDPRYDLDTLRQQWHITTPPERTVLLTFGGLGLQSIPYEGLNAFPDWHFVTFDRQAPPLPHITSITDRKYRPVDVMPLCGRVVSKPGYSTFAEALRLNIPIVSLTREGFAEAPVLLEGIRDYSWHQIVHTEDFWAGHWSFLTQSPQPPRLSPPLAKDGDITIAERILSYLNGH